MARILVIDDSNLARQLARVAFQPAGHELLESSDGEAGLAIMRRERLDCVVLDLLMPGTTGCDVLRTMKQERLNVPVIVVTADVQTTTRDECLKLGAALVINKPKSPDELLDAVSQVLPAESDSSS